MHWKKNAVFEELELNGKLKTRTTTVAILHRMQKDIEGKWAYYASGAERECRLVPTEVQALGAKGGNPSIAFSSPAASGGGKDQTSFYVHNHFEERTLFTKTKSRSGRPNRRRDVRINGTSVGINTLNQGNYQFIHYYYVTSFSGFVPPSLPIS